MPRRLQSCCSSRLDSNRPPQRPKPPPPPPWAIRTSSSSRLETARGTYEDRATGRAFALDGGASGRLALPGLTAFFAGRALAFAFFVEALVVFDGMRFQRSFRGSLLRSDALRRK